MTVYIYYEVNGKWDLHKLFYSQFVNTESEIAKYYAKQFKLPFKNINFDRIKILVNSKHFTFKLNPHKLTLGVKEYMLENEETK